MIALVVEYLYVLEQSTFLLPYLTAWHYFASNLCKISISSHSFLKSSIFCNFGTKVGNTQCKLSELLPKLITIKGCSYKGCYQHCYRSLLLHKSYLIYPDFVMYKLIITNITLWHSDALLWLFWHG